jgi:hypothetical protein
MLSTIRDPPTVLFTYTLFYYIFPSDSGLKQRFNQTFFCLNNTDREGQRIPTVTTSEMVIVSAVNENNAVGPTKKPFAYIFHLIKKMEKI